MDKLYLSLVEAAGSLDLKVLVLASSHRFFFVMRTHSRVEKRLCNSGAPLVFQWQPAPLQSWLPHALGAMTYRRVERTNVCLKNVNYLAFTLLEGTIASTRIDGSCTICTYHETTYTTLYRRE